MQLSMVFLSGHEYNRTQSADCFQNGIQKIAVEPSLIFVTVIICWNIELVFEGLDIGLGIELNEEAAKAHPKQDHWLRHYVGTLTNIRPPDSVRYYHV